MPVYRMVDEPTPGRLEAYIVSPQWPCIAHFLGGSWIALPWYIFNSRALGSATARRELTLALLSPILSLALAVVAFGLIDILHAAAPPAALVAALGLPDRAGSYAAIFVIALKLAFNYLIFHHQEKSFEIWLYTGGRSRNAAVVLAAAYLLRPIVVGAAFAVSPWLGIVVV